jgi:hypothetical protein
MAQPFDATGKDLLESDPAAWMAKPRPSPGIWNSGSPMAGWSMTSDTE